MALLFRRSVICLLLQLAGLVSSWTVSSDVYFVTGFVGVQTQGLGCPAPNATALSTFTSTTTEYFGSDLIGGGDVIVSYIYIVYDSTAPTVTDVDLSACTPISHNSATPSNTISTSYYGPAILSNPASCTKTSFTYTTAEAVAVPSFFASQATDPTNAAVATVLSSFVSTDVGGQSVVTSWSAIYLKPEAFANASAVPYGGEESSYLDQCVDPRRFFCSTSLGIPSNYQQATSLANVLTGTPTGTCPLGPGTYPPIQTGGKGATSTNAGATGSSASPTHSGSSVANGIASRLLAVLAPFAFLLAYNF